MSENIKAGDDVVYINVGDLTLPLKRGHVQVYNDIYCRVAFNVCGKELIEICRTEYLILQKDYDNTQGCDKPDKRPAYIPTMVGVRVRCIKTAFRAMIGDEGKVIDFDIRRHLFYVRWDKGIDTSIHPKKVEIINTALLPVIGLRQTRTARRKKFLSK